MHYWPRAAAKESRDPGKYANTHSSSCLSRSNGKGNGVYFCLSLYFINSFVFKTRNVARKTKQLAVVEHKVR
jgi:hypothetical protein